METAEIEIRWSNHAVVRAYKRFGRYTMELINEKVVKAIERQDFRPSVSKITKIHVLQRSNSVKEVCSLYKTFEQ